MNKSEQPTQLRSSPELTEKLYQYSILKSYSAGSIILNKNAHIRSIPVITKSAYNNRLLKTIRQN